VVTGGKREALQCVYSLHYNTIIFPVSRFSEGFGQVLLSTIRQAQKMSMHKPVEFPLTLGRDFCGEIIAKGVKVKSFDVGDVVMGVVPPFHQGCHSEFVAVPEGLVRYKLYIHRFLSTYSVQCSKIDNFF